jgi:hypothetical protein
MLSDGMTEDDETHLHVSISRANGYGYHITQGQACQKQRYYLGLTGNVKGATSENGVDVTEVPNNVRILSEDFCAFLRPLRMRRPGTVHCILPPCQLPS